MTKNNLLEAPKAERRHLRRLETLVDVIFAMVIVIVVAGFPSARDFDGNFATPWELAWLAGIPISIIINWIAKKSSKV